jgi:hypothetical protein
MASVPSVFFKLFNAVGKLVALESGENSTGRLPSLPSPGRELIQYVPHAACPAVVALDHLQGIGGSGGVGSSDGNSGALLWKREGVARPIPDAQLVITSTVCIRSW